MATNIFQAKNVILSRKNRGIAIPVWEVMSKVLSSGRINYKSPDRHFYWTIIGANQILRIIRRPIALRDRP
jgi:hypothetical protein